MSNGYRKIQDAIYNALKKEEGQMIDNTVYENESSEDELLEDELPAIQ